jgi:hypothetical protein
VTLFVVTTIVKDENFMAWLLGELFIVLAHQFQVHRQKIETTIRFKALQWKLNGETFYWAHNMMQRGNPLAQEAYVGVLS